MVGKKNYLLETFFLVFPLFLTTVLYAQSEQVRTLTTANGLSQGMVTGLLQDKQGFIWAATLNGLNRYDGHRFKVYLHDNDDSTSIASNTLYALSEDRLGRIWMGTAAGIDCFDPQTERFWHLGQQYYLGMNEGAKDAPTQAISSLVMDSAGVLWVVSNSTISRIVVPDDFL
ncbi:MAG: hypothetical protein RI894_953, partial [Bacteroidota bacterium]